jgi:TolB-like protein/AraC-like DNA-binding protein/TPR repeat protein
MERSNKLSTDEVFIDSLTEAVLANLGNEQFGVEELSKAIGLSRSQIHRKLQKILGKSVTQFIREIRLKEAYELLINEAGTAAEISYKVGFNSPTYFSTCFHEYFGFPPGEVKKRKSEAFGVQIQGYENDGIISIRPSEKRSSNKDKFHEIRNSNLTVFRSGSNRKQRNLWIVVLSISLILIIAYFSLFFFPRINPQNRSIFSSQVREKSIAVLPFNYLEGPQEKSLTDGIVADIQYNLSMMGDLRVISRTSMERFRDSKLSVKEISKELDVNFLLEGNVQKFDNDVKIHVSLIDGKSEEIIWTNVYQQNLESYFETQNRIASQVAAAMYVNITPEENQRILKVHTNNPTAYTFFIKAKEEHNKHWLYQDIVALDHAIHYYRQALDHDSTFANAWASLGMAYYDKIGLKYVYNQEWPFWDSLRIFSDKAIQYDNQLGVAYLVKSIYEYAINGEVDEAIEYIDLALQYDPNSSRSFEQKAILLWFGKAKHKEAIIYTTEASKRVSGIEQAKLYGYLERLYVEMGFNELAEKYIRSGYILRKNDTISSDIKKTEIIYANNLAFMEFAIGHYAKSIDLYEKSATLDTSQIISPVFLIAARQYDRAYDQSIRYLRITNGNPRMSDLHRIGFSFWQMGERKKAMEYFNLHLEKTLKAIEGKSVYAIRKYAYYDLAATYAFLGHVDSAFAALNNLKNAHTYPVYLVNMLKTDDPMFDNIRNDLRFTDIVDHVEERYQMEREKVGKWLIEMDLYDHTISEFL